MNQKDELEVWKTRVTKLETALEKAITSIKVMRNAKSWHVVSENEINQRIQELKEALTPF